MKTSTQQAFEKREARQIRAIKKYAKALKLDLETACMRWVTKGHAKAWAKQN